MKKLLLVCLSLGILGSALAQVNQIKPKAWYKQVKETRTHAKDAPSMTP